jgi:hypothetical protein
MSMPRLDWQVPPPAASRIAPGALFQTIRFEEEGKARFALLAMTVFDEARLLGVRKFKLPFPAGAGFELMLVK